MIDIQNLKQRFSIPGILSVSKRDNNFIYVNVSNQYADAEVFLYGAHITSFKPKNEEEILWMSPASNFIAGKAIRGGIPVCFPWFGPHKTDIRKPQHGFGRLMEWNLTSTGQNSIGETLIRLELSSSEETRAYWPCDFFAEMAISVGKTLKATLKITNISNAQFGYSCALHTYYSISSIEEIKIEGLKGSRYYKNDVAGKFIQESPKLEIHELVDRHYYETESTIVIEDPNLKRNIRATKKGSRVTTVWNPWLENCCKISDMPDYAYKSFVCVEAVNSFDDTIILNPGESHETSVSIGLE